MEIDIHKLIVAKVKAGRNLALSIEAIKLELEEDCSPHIIKEIDFWFHRSEPGDPIGPVKVTITLDNGLKL